MPASNLPTPIEAAINDGVQYLGAEFPFLSADLHFIIRAYEEGSRNKGTEEGLLASVYGDINNADSAIGTMMAGAMSYPGSENAANGNFVVEPPNFDPFAGSWLGNRPSSVPLFLDPSS